LGQLIVEKMIADAFGFIPQRSDPIPLELLIPKDRLFNQYL
jgi:hypothetical protein